MSVVNKMLQDLEARKNAPEMISADYVPPSSSKHHIWLVSVLVLVLALAAFLWFIGPQWMSSSRDASSVADVNTAQGQPNAELARPAIEKSIKAEKENINNKLANDPIENATITPYETTLVNTPVESMPAKIKPMLNTQATVETSPQDATAQTAKLSENSVETSDTKQPKPESRFSRSDSSEKNKVAGAKQSVISALSEGNNGLAIKRLEELLRVQADNIEARKKLAALLFAEKRSKQAEHVLLQGINKHPARSDLRLMMARLYMQRKDHKGAIKLLTEVEPDAANKMEFLAYRAALLQQNAHFNAAMVDYINLLEADSTNAKWWLGLAITQDRLGQTNEALSAYRHAYDKEQLSPSVIKFVEQRMSQIEGAR